MNIQQNKDIRSGTQDLSFRDQFAHEDTTIGTGMFMNIEKDGPLEQINLSKINGPMKEIRETNLNSSK